MKTRRNYASRLVFLAATGATLGVGSFASAESADPNVHRRYGLWNSSRIGGGGYLQNVAFTRNPKVSYVWADVGGLYRSDDAGRTWHMLHGALPARSGSSQVRSVNVDPRDENKIVVTVGSHWEYTRDGIYISNDGGRSFTFAHEAMFAGNSDNRWAGDGTARHPEKPDRVFAGSMGDGILVSDDAGKSWRVTGLTGLQITDVDIDRTNPDRVLVCALPYDHFLLGNANHKLDGGFFRSDDAGATWTKVADVGPDEITQSLAEPNRWIGTFANRQIVTSTDSGTTWTNFHEGLPSGEGIGGGANGESFSAIGVGPDFFLVGSGDGTIYRRGTTDSAWRRVEPAGRQKPEWSFLKLPGGDGWYHFGRAMSSISVNPRDPNHWVFTDWYSIVQSHDAGQNWEVTIDGIETTVIHTIVPDPTDEQVVHLGMADNGYFRSTDGGRTFIQNARGITNNVKSISVAPDGKTLYATGPGVTGHWHSNAIFVSNDSGLGWRRCGGLGLPEMTGHFINTVAVDPGDSQRVMVAVSGEVAPGKGGPYLSDDGGENWRWVGEGLPNREKMFRSEIWVVGRELAISNDGSVVAISHDAGGVFAFDKNGATWTRSLDDTLAAIEVQADPHTPGRFLIATRDGLRESTDGGRTWSTLATGFEAKRVSFDTAKPGSIVVGTGTGPLISRDHGKTFLPLDTALPCKVSNIVGMRGGRVYVGTLGSGAFWAVPESK